MRACDALQQCGVDAGVVGWQRGAALLRRCSLCCRRCARALQHGIFARPLKRRSFLLQHGSSSES
jgi:hypothetical protein